MNSKEEYNIIQFVDLKIDDWFKSYNDIYKKVGEYMAELNGKNDDVWKFSLDCMIRPIDVEISEKVPGEVSVEVDANAACVLEACDNCQELNGPSCCRHEYTWTITATPKVK